MGRPREVSDEQILSTARRVFLEHGHSVSTGVIAAELGVSAPALFHRFGTKQNLFVRAMILGGFVPPVVVLDERPIGEQLLDLVLVLDGSFRAVAPAIAVLKAAGFGPADLPEGDHEPPPVRMRIVVESWLEAAIEAGRIGPVDPEVAGHMLLGVVLGSNMDLLRLGTQGLTEVPRERYEELVRLLLKALGPVRD